VKKILLTYRFLGDLVLEISYKMQSTKYNTLGTVSNTNSKIDTSITQIHARPLSWIGTVTSIKTMAWYSKKGYGEGWVPLTGLLHTIFVLGPGFPTSYVVGFFCVQ